MLFGFLRAFAGPSVESSQMIHNSPRQCGHPQDKGLMPSQVFHRPDTHYPLKMAAHSPMLRRRAGLSLRPGRRASRSPDALRPSSAAIAKILQSNGSLRAPVAFVHTRRLLQTMGSVNWCPSPYLPTQSLHQPFALIGPSTSLQEAGEMNSLQFAQFWLPLGEFW